jgi:Bacterial Ig-like domain
MNHRLVEYRAIVSLGVLALVACTASSPAAAGCDATPPQLNALVFSTPSIDTTLSQQTVVCDMTVVDDWSGVEKATCELESSFLGQTRSCSTSEAASGHARDGMFSCSVAFPRFVDSGTWFARIKLVDAAGNARTILPSSQLFVSSDADVVAPVLSGFSFSPASVDVSLSDETVTCTMQVTDAKSGVELVRCTLAAPGSGQEHGCDATQPAPGTSTYSCSFRLPQHAESGSWAPTVRLRDRVGNVADVPFGPSLAVNSATPDTVDPALSGAGLFPTTASTGEAPRAVRCSMSVSDAVSGVVTARCRLTQTDPVDPTLVRMAECTSYRASPGTPQAGIFRCGLTLPRSSAAGPWTAEVLVVDRAGNESTFVTGAQIVTDCSNGDLETTARFSDPTTLEWDPIVGASRYNVYRGDLAGLVDGNLDSLPDGGYGACQNGRDPDPTDTTFVDTDVPGPVEIGFHYLVSYTTTLSETGLGYDRAGRLRTVFAVCP